MSKRNFKSTKLSTVLSSTGLGLFLVVGFNGCDGDIVDDCKQYSNLPKQSIDECNERKRSYNGGTAIVPMNNGYSSHSTGSGYFGSSDSSSSHSSSGG